MTVNLADIPDEPACPSFSDTTLLASNPRAWSAGTTRAKRAATGPPQPTRAPEISRSFARSCRAEIRRTVPDRERITSDSVVAPRAV